MSGGSGKGHTDEGGSGRSPLGSIDRTVHDLRNALAGVRGAVQIVREPMAATSMEREILGEVLTRVDQMDELLLRLAAAGRQSAES